MQTIREKNMVNVRMLAIIVWLKLSLLPELDSLA